MKKVIIGLAVAVFFALAIVGFANQPQRVTKKIKNEEYHEIMERDFSLVDRWTPFLFLLFFVLSGCHLVTSFTEILKVKRDLTFTTIYDFQQQVIIIIITCCFIFERGEVLCLLKLSETI